MKKINKVFSELENEFRQMPNILIVSKNLTDEQKEAIFSNLNNMLMCMKQLNDTILNASINNMNEQNAN